MIENVLLIPAGSDPEQSGARRAVAICRATNAKLALFENVYEPHLEGYLGDSELYESLRQRIVDERGEALQNLAQALAAKGCQCTANAVWGSSLHGSVSRTVVQDGIDLVIVAPEHRPGRLSRADWRLVSQCPAPVLVVNSDGRDDYRDVLAAVDPYHIHGKPHGLDRRIIDIAKHVAGLSNAQLRVVHCFTPIADIIRHGYAEAPIDAAEEALEAARRDALTELVAAGGLDPASAELVAGKPGDVLIAAADGEHADLIVIGAVSRGIFRDFFIGSTSEKVLEEARCDVLVIKPPGFEIRISV